MPFCQVIVDINHTDVDHVFTYRVPKGLCVCPGMRVHVPFGPRKLEGVVVEMTEECDLPPERVKDVCDTLEDYPAVLPPLLALARDIQRSSFCTLAMALRLMFPAQMRGQRIREKRQEVAVLTVAPDVLGQVIAAQIRAPKRAKVLRALADAPEICLPPKKALSLPSVSRSDAPVEASACKAASISCFSAALTIDLFSRNVGRMATPPSRPRSA